MRSDEIKTGVERTPNRSLLYALGYTDEELSRPLIGVVSSYNEIVPGHMGLDKIAEAVKAGIRMAHIALLALIHQHVDNLLSGVIAEELP